MVDRDATSSFNEIFDETYKKVYIYVKSKVNNKDDISDIMQDIYTELYGIIQKKGPDHINNKSAYVMKLAKNIIYRHYTLREKLGMIIPMFKKDTDDEEINVIDLELSNADVEDTAVNRAALSDIWTKLSCKDDTIKRIFYMYYYLDLTIRQIAEELSINQSTVKNKLYNTVKELRAVLKQDNYNCS